jgi:hypothetical protein
MWMYSYVSTAWVTPYPPYAPAPTCVSCGAPYAGSVAKGERGYVGALRVCGYCGSAWQNRSEDEH